MVKQRVGSQPLKEASMKYKIEVLSDKAMCRPKQNEHSRSRHKELFFQNKSKRVGASSGRFNTLNERNFLFENSKASILSRASTRKLHYEKRQS